MLQHQRIHPYRSQSLLGDLQSLLHPLCVGWLCFISMCMFLFIYVLLRRMPTLLADAVHCTARRGVMHGRLTGAAMPICWHVTPGAMWTICQYLTDKAQKVAAGYQERNDYY